MLALALARRATLSRLLDRTLPPRPWQQRCRRRAGLAEPCASSIRAAVPSGRRVCRVLAGRASARGADLPREPGRFVCERVYALDIPAPSAGGSQDAVAGAASALLCRSDKAPVRLLRSAARRTSAFGWSVSRSLLAVRCPPGVSPFVPVIRHPPVARQCRSCSCVLSRKAYGRRRHRLPRGDVTGRRCCREGRCSGRSPWGGRVSSSA
jgi:hypothetical protein